jgi:co-chaperonin GroES (HSP10)
MADLPIIPCGYQILVKMQKAKAKTAGGILLPDDSRDGMEMKSARGQVVAVGPDAYTGNHSDGSPRYPSGPYCKIGDWVEWNRYQERRIHLGPDKDEYAFVHDDRILGNWGTKEPVSF